MLKIKKIFSKQIPFLWAAFTLYNTLTYIYMEYWFLFFFVKSFNGLDELSYIIYCYDMLKIDLLKPQPLFSVSLEEVEYGLRFANDSWLFIFNTLTPICTQYYKMHHVVDALLFVLVF